MKFSRAISVGVAAALVLSLAGKALTRMPVEPDTRLFTTEVRRRLIDSGFDVQTVSRPSGAYLFGSRGSCRLMISEQDAMGQLQDRNRQFARSVGPMRLVWRGRLLDRTPRAEIVVRFLARRQLTRIGIVPPREPLAAVAGNAACDMAELAALPPRTLPR